MLEAGFLASRSTGAGKVRERTIALEDEMNKFTTFTDCTVTLTSHQKLDLIEQHTFVRL
jgi:hypothetical protein